MCKSSKETEQKVPRPVTACPIDVGHQNPLQENKKQCLHQNGAPGLVAVTAPSLSWQPRPGRDLKAAELLTIPADGSTTRLSSPPSSLLLSVGIYSNLRNARHHD